jgi:hypothetical protein
MDNFKVGERVAFTITDQDEINYYGRSNFIGAIKRRLQDGFLRIEMEGTGSQDSEGYNSYADVCPALVRKLDASPMRQHSERKDT